MSAAPELAELLETARTAVRAASQLLATARPEAIQSKSNPRDLVTEWDLRSEELIRRVLDERAPGIPVLGEEGGMGQAARPTPGSLRWLVDPIDGTVNFAHGLPIWSVSIGLERLPDALDAGELLVGVVAAPRLGWWFEGSKGGGARDGDGAPIRVSALEGIASALLSTGFPYDINTNALDNLAEWDHMQRRSGGCRRLGSAALDVCTVACGWVDGYWERHLKAWDVGAGAVIAREAGATLSGFAGEPFDLHAGELVVTNGAIHAALLAELAAARR